MRGSTRNDTGKWNEAEKQQQKGSIEHCTFCENIDNTCTNTETKESQQQRIKRIYLTNTSKPRKSFQANKNSHAANDLLLAAGCIQTNSHFTLISKIDDLVSNKFI